MENIIIGMLAETPVHIGAGESSGFVDLPVARESITSYPVIPSTGLKGSFKESYAGDDKERIFGKQDDAGKAVFSEGRLLLLPVRSLDGQYKWITCPYIIERLKRDLKRTNKKVENIDSININEPERNHVYTKGTEKIFLEEREFEIKQSVDNEIINLFKRFIPNEDTAERLENQIAILNNDDFKWFAQYGLSVNARNVLKENKTSKNLWYEELIPTDTVFYTILFQRGENVIESIKKMIEEKPYIQLGGNETVGQGWFNIKMCF